MAFDIYKKGQGKYTRIITFVAAMFLVLIGAVQLSAQLSKLPDIFFARWDFAPVVTEGQTLSSGGAVGQVVETEADGTQTQAPVVLPPGVSGTLQFVAPAGQYAVDDVIATVKSSTAKTDVTLAEQWTGAAVAPAPAHGLRIKVYLQYGIPTLVVIALGLVLFWIVNRQKSADFLIETEGEMKKVSWSNFKEIVGSTKVVIVTTFIMAVILFCTDLLFLYVFRQIGVQEF